MEVALGLDVTGWNRVLEQLPLACRDVYFTPGYLGLHAANGEGEPFFSAVSDGTALLAVSGLRAPIAGPCGPRPGGLRWDLQTPNGYGGPLASEMADRAFLNRAWTAWKRASAEAGLVAAFFRLHPPLGNERWLPADVSIRADRQTVFVDLSRGAEAVWTNSSSRHRNMVRKGRRQGQPVRWGEAADRDDFERLYAASTERLSAPPSLRFAPRYFSALWELPGTELAAIRDEQGLAGGAVFVSGPLWWHYHLAARRADSGNHVTSALLQAALECAAARRLRGLHLGGGRTRSPADSLLSFKRSLGGQLLDFKVALVVANDEAYGELTEAWRGKARREPQWLLGYREPTS